MAGLKGLNEQQKTAVTHKGGPLLVVAGAGTGKTEVITQRIAHLIRVSGAKPAEILAVTFTEKAAREMEARLSELLGKYILDVNITTFNSFGHDLLRRFAYDIGLSPELILLNDAQQMLFLRDHLRELELDYYAPVTNPEKFLSDLGRYFATLKSELISPPQYTNFIQKLPSNTEALELKRQTELATAYSHYQELMRKHNFVDFEDQIYLCVDLLEKRPNIRNILRKEIKWVLVDEFQDTNLSQSRLLDLLVGINGNITVVGDDDQSIYRFRGAAVSNILQFRQRHPKSRVVTLVKNYRSTQTILDHAYKLIRHNNPDRLEYQYALDKRLLGTTKGSPALVKQLSQYEEEASWIAKDIAGRLRKGQVGSEVAILLRKNSQATLIERNLEALNIDYIVVGQEENLYKQPAVKQLLQFLQVVVNPKDSENLFHLLASEIYRLPVAWLREQVSAANRLHEPLEKQLNKYLDDVKAAHFEQVQTLLSQLSGWRDELSRSTVGQLCYRILDDTKHLRKLVKKARLDPAAEQQVNHLRQFFNSLREYEQIALDSTAVGYVASLSALLGAGEQVDIEDLSEVFGDRVRIMTIHKAKGLEFELVYLFDLTQGTFPSRELRNSLEVPSALLASRRSISGQTHIQEERRLCYVGITRAKQNLIVSYSIDHGGKLAKKPSQFLAEAFDHSYTIAPKPAGLDKGVQQIELFKTKKAKSALLPPSIWQGDRLVLSARQIEDYLMCPAEFYLRYVISPPQPPSVTLEYGTIMHGAVQLYNQSIQDGKKLRLSDLLTYIRDNWPPEGYLDKNHQMRALLQAENSLKRWHKREQAAKQHPKYVEKPFQLNIEDLQLTIRGRMDAIYDEEGNIEIRDYKTGSPHIKDQANVDQRSNNSLQLGIYAFAWENLQGKIPKLLTLDFLDSGLIGSSKRTARQLETVTQKISRVAEGVRNQDFTPAKSHIFCSHKEYGF